MKYSWRFNIPALLLLALKDGLIKRVKYADAMRSAVVGYEVSRPKEKIRGWSDVTDEIVRRFNTNRAILILEARSNQAPAGLSEPVFTRGCITFKKNETNRQEAIEFGVKERFRDQYKLVDFVLCQEISNGLKDKLRSERGGGSSSLINREVQNLFDKQLITKISRGGSEWPELTTRGLFLAQLLSSESMGSPMDTRNLFDVKMAEVNGKQEAVK